MKLATIRTAAGTTAVRVDGDGARRPRRSPTSARCSPGPTGVAAPRQRRRRGARRRRCRLRPGRAPPRQDRLRRAATTATTSSRWAASCPSTPRCSPSSPRRSSAPYDDDRAARRQSEAVDWEAELAVVIGTQVRHADGAQAAAAIAGYTVLNDVTARDWQYRTPQWLQGKTFEAHHPGRPGAGHRRTTPGGPPGRADLRRSTARSCRRPTPPTSCSARSRWSLTSPRSSRWSPAT